MVGEPGQQRTAGRVVGADQNQVTASGLVQRLQCAHPPEVPRPQPGLRLVRRARSPGWGRLVRRAAAGPPLADAALSIRGEELDFVDPHHLELRYAT